MKRQFRVKIADKSDADHWTGGKPYHRGAHCPTCQIPLLLLWDINCKDPRFPRGKFGSLSRLHLYYCWGCVNDLSYQVVNKDEIRIHPGARTASTSFPYEPYPASFERRGLVLSEGMPEEIWRIHQRLTARWHSAKDGPKNAPIPLPSLEEQRTLTEFFGHHVPVPMCFFYHQLGGAPLKHDWAAEVFECPNPDCGSTLIDRLRGRKSAMKFLAGVLNEPRVGLPMVEPANDDTRENWNYLVSVQYHICDSCWTVLGCNRSD